MSRELVESILNNDYVSANRLLEEKLSDIQEKKLYEVKRSIQLVELGPVNYKKSYQELKASGAPRASEVLSTPKKPSTLKKVAKSKWPGRVGFGIGRAIKMTGGVLSDIGSQLTPHFE